MNILVVDADPMYCCVVSSLLQLEVDFEVVGQARNGAEAVEKAQVLRPDVILMNVQLPEINGLQAVRKIRAVLPRVKLVMCTSSEQSEEFMQTIRAGVHGYLPKQIEPEGLYRCLRAAYHGEVVISRTATTWLFEAFSSLAQERPDADSSLAELSPREREVLELLVPGVRNKEITSHFDISENTVKSHLKSILMKLGLQNRRQAMTYALRVGKGNNQNTPQEMC